ncbi:UNVERIFIED_CONTAM: hypothetical protein K2H54_038616 [Gekko kuhli]
MQKSLYCVRLLSIVFFHLVLFCAFVGNQYLRIRQGSVFLFNVDYGNFSEILTNDTLAAYSASEAILSADQKFALLRYDYKKRRVQQMSWDSLGLWSVPEHYTKMHTKVHLLFPSDAIQLSSLAIPKLTETPLLERSHWRELQWPQHEKVWRHSYNASYIVYDLENSATINDSLPKDIQYISWSPVGHKLAYVQNNDLYVKETPATPSVRITTNGKENIIFNGLADWVYEEEMFGTHAALWWSPNGSFLAYAEINDTDVPVIEYSFYAEDTLQYPKTIRIPYPKDLKTVESEMRPEIGATNPTIRLFVVNTESLSNISSTEISAPSDILSGDHYLSVVTWVTDERICLQWLRRIQNFSVLTICDYSRENGMWQCPQEKEHKEESTTGWIGRFQPSEPYFASDNTGFYKILSDEEGFKHIHYISGTGAKKNITSGKWEVINIAAVTNDFLYFISNKFEGKPGGRNLYKVDFGTGSTNCITCNLYGERCQYYSASFSTDATYYKLNCHGPGLPYFILQNSSTDKAISILEDNQDLDNTLKNIQMPSKTVSSIGLHGEMFWYQMILPPHFDESKQYPLLIDV